MEKWLIQLLQLMLSLSILVLIHELGHYIFAKIFKVRVEKFYLFFDPWFSLFKYKPKNGHTEFGLGWIPLGGYCKISGMIDESIDTKQLKQPIETWEFRGKPAWQRLIIMSAGVVFNFIFALIIYSMLLFVSGEEYVSIKDAKLGMNFNETAKSIGFQDKDVIVSIDEEPAIKFDLRKIVNAKKVSVLRDGIETNIFIPEDLMNQLMSDSLYFARFIPPLVIDSVIEGSVASFAGLMPGDSIVKLNGKPTNLFDFHKQLNEMQNEFKLGLNDDGINVLSFLFYRSGECQKIDLQLNDENLIIGIVAKSNLKEILPTINVKYSISDAFLVGATLGINTLSNYVADIRYVFSKEGIKHVGGFGTIGSIFSVTWDWYQFWYLTAFLSIILAFMNILPIPALDGGHVLFTLYEIVSRKKPSDKFLVYAQISGMILLLILLVYANVNDIFKWLIK